MNFKLRMPDTYTIIFGFVLIMGLLTHIIPSGKFERVFKNGKQVVIAGTYKTVEPRPQTLMQILKAPIRGLMEAIEVISYVFIIGGVISIITKSGAMTSGLNALIRIFGKNYQILIILIMMIVGIGGSTTGTWTEVIPFYIILTPVMLRIGLDPMVVVAMLTGSAATGSMASTTNPFAAGIASKLAEIDISQGFYFRVLIFILCMGFMIGWTLYYAYKVKLDRKNSMVADLFPIYEETFLKEEVNVSQKFTIGHKMILLIFGAGIILVGWGLLMWNWYIQEMAAVYIAMGALTWLFGRMNERDVMGSFVEGVKDVASAGVMIGLSRSIVVISSDGLILDTILHGITSSLEGVHNIVFLNVTLFIHALIGVLVPSSSGHAALTIPIMVGIADVLEVQRELVVTVYMYGTGIANYITPTGGIIMGMLAIAGVPWIRWVRFIMPPLVVFTLIYMILVSIKYYIINL